jgi:hypothetical protein
MAEQRKPGCTGKRRHRTAGVTPQYVSMVLNAQRPASDALLAAVGLRRITVRANA